MVKQKSKVLIKNLERGNITYQLVGLVKWLWPRNAPDVYLVVFGVGTTQQEC